MGIIREEAGTKSCDQARAIIKHLAIGSEGKGLFLDDNPFQFGFRAVAIPKNRRKKAPNGMDSPTEGSSILFVRKPIAGTVGVQLIIESLIPRYIILGSIIRDPDNEAGPPIMVLGQLIIKAKTL
jgi:hypothetical protein